MVLWSRNESECLHAKRNEARQGSQLSVGLILSDGRTFFISEKRGAEFTAGKQRRRGRNNRKRIAGAEVVRYGAAYELVVWLGVGVAATAVYM
jgi:hypothetical protein